MTGLPVIFISASPTLTEYYFTGHHYRVSSYQFTYDNALFLYRPSSRQFQYHLPSYTFYRTRKE